jgi:membrane associated rhomboid family serine protease
LISTYILAAIFFASVAAFQYPKLKESLLFVPYRVKERNEHWRWFSHVFVHANWSHLLINLWVFYTFVGHVESAFQTYFLHYRVAFIVFLLTAAIASSALDFVKNKFNAGYASLGASGVVASVLFVYIMLFPTAPLQFIFLPGVDIPAFVIGAMYLLYEYKMRQKQDGIAHDAHIFGALFGVLTPFVMDPELYVRFVVNISHWLQNIFS